ncbi:MAG: hypothetical protein RLZZ387_2893 [Chloroflexota bacterium]
MYEIRPWLHVGGFRDSMDEEQLALYEIDVVLQLAATLPSPQRRTLLLSVEDGEPIAQALLRRGVDFVQEAHREGKVCLVACGAGISRSVAFAVAALREIEGLGLIEAAVEVKRGNPDAVFHPVLWESLAEFAGEDVPFRVALPRIDP